MLGLIALACYGAAISAPYKAKSYCRNKAKARKAARKASKSKSVTHYHIW